MKTWKKLTVARTCGSCVDPTGMPVTIPAGAPVLVLDVGGILKFRCPSCAGEPVPDPFPMPQQVMDVMSASVKKMDFSSLRRLADQAFEEGYSSDFKVRQAGEREPGEEG